MSVHVLKGDIELCHLTTFPVCPDKVSNPLVLPEHIVVPPVTLPPTEVGSTVTVVAVEFTGEHTPLCTTALNCVVCVNAPDVYVVPVWVMSVQVLKGDTELCHLTTPPVWPDNVSKPLELPEHIVVPPVTLPPTVVGSIVREAFADQG